MLYLFYSLSKRQQKNEESARKISSIREAIKRGAFEKDRRDVNTSTVNSLLLKDHHEKAGDGASFAKESLNNTQGNENLLKEDEKPSSLKKKIGYDED